MKKQTSPSSVDALLKELSKRISSDQQELERLRVVVKRQEAVIAALVSTGIKTMPVPKAKPSPKVKQAPKPVPQKLDAILKKKGRPTKEEQALIAAAGIKRRVRIRPNPSGRKPGRPKKDEIPVVVQPQAAEPKKKASSGKKREAAPQQKVVVVMRRRAVEKPAVQAPARPGAMAPANSRTGLVTRAEAERKFRELFSPS